ncbi:hypothetical protein [Candidatus Nitrosocosmicus hydrocola]|uniref:hypothetical protein n=1 Tax=Candidatus Nitrosocosmicus hydrocola TaxID=1826872 RepID=UPI0011E59376|nr:hypothetical protein [Candidatus Nitrosocosmicus hydrocola]
MIKRLSNNLYLATFVIVSTILLAIGGPFVHIFAQTPTTSDFPATIGNESNTDMKLTNSSLPVENTSTIVAPPRL